jgi:hypothetical protein
MRVGHRIEHGNLWTLRCPHIASKLQVGAHAHLPDRLMVLIASGGRPDFSAMARSCAMIA